MKRNFVPALLCVLSSQAALADAVYDEAVYGDFHGGQLFFLDPGVNTFVGSHGFGDDDRFDGFRFVIPDGQRASIQFSFWISGLADGEDVGTVWEFSELPAAEPCTPSGFAYACVLPGDSTLLASEVFESSPGSAAPLPGNYPPIQGYDMDAGVYLLNDNFWIKHADAPVFNYVATIDVQAVPLPPAGLLFTSGLLLGIAGRTRCALRVRQ